MLWSVRTEEREGVRLTRARWRGPAARAPRKWALWADLHLSADPAAEYRGFWPEANLAAAMDQTLAFEPDLVMVNGDLSWNDGLLDDYGRLRERIAPILERFPFAFTPGNHDHRERLFLMMGLTPPEGDRKAPALIETPDARMLILDSLYRTDVVPGLLGREQRRRLAELLDESEQPTYVFVHHPLHDDDGALLDAPRLLEVLERRSQVVAVFTAHDHVFGEALFGRVRVVTQPAIGMAFEPDEKVGWIEAEFGPDGERLNLREIEQVR